MRETTLPPVWSALAKEAGGVDELADALGCTRMAVWHWAHGGRMGSKSARKRVNDWAKRRGLREPFDA
jgi:hypothetical protein